MFIMYLKYKLLHTANVCNDVQYYHYIDYHNDHNNDMKFLISIYHIHGIP